MNTNIISKNGGNRIVLMRCIVVFLILIFVIIQISINNMFYYETFEKDGEIKNFTILGERCSGTFFLQHAMEKNFSLPLTWHYGWKHWFGDHNQYENSDETLFIGLYRHPVDWMNSLFRDQHHLDKKMKDKQNFLNEPVQNFDWTQNGKEIEGTRHLYTGEIYKNIFELRTVKLDYLINEFPKRVKNVEIFSYEEFKDNYVKILKYLQKKYKLNKRPRFPQKITYHLVGGRVNTLPKKKTFLLEDVKPFLNQDLEKKAGYVI